ncbi:hypothetical protein PVK06_009648 [Gossypium arboreum]|uniref:Retrotransposon Copia-like N-terminal domain-containing protein n=1 Tax=Gossypium arboreum TaxID=29729 RepID=A0ABR0QN33_GOSAR|nr:hypothetical protein PVK06_009648 [Gossypium arboreum]
MVNPSDSIIDFNHPFYLHPSDIPGTLLVSHQLVGVEYYNVWSRTMKIALLAKNKLGFVDGTCSKDSLPDEIDFKFTKKKANNGGSVMNNASISDIASGNEVTNDVGMHRPQAPVFT